MGQVSNRFFVTSIKDGTLVTAALYSDTTLAQLITPGTNASSPDWTDPNEQPTVWCVVRAGATTKTPSSFKWYLNGNEILFPANPTTGTASTNFAGIFKWATVIVDGVTCAALKIAGNIITITNQDNDVLTCSGYVEYNGAQIEYTVNTTIRMSTLSGSGYYGWISGDSYVTSQSASAVMKARLRTADGTVNNFYTKWYREGIDTSTPFATAQSANGGETGVAQVSILGSQITDYVVMRVDYYENSSSTDILYSAYWDVDDMEDDEEMYMCSYVVNNVKGGLDVSLREGQSVQMLVWMGKRGDQTNIDARYQVAGSTYKCRILDSEGATITNYTDSGVTTGSGSLIVDTNGFLNIKSSAITIPGVTGTKVGGSIVIPATFADAHGGKLTGIVVVTA